MPGISDLLEIKESPLPHVGNRFNWSMARNGIPTYEGVYVFWWIKGLEHFISALQNDTLYFNGPGGAERKIKIKSDLLSTASNGLLALYVGKTASGINQRIVKHLMPTLERTLPHGNMAIKYKRKNTTCQVRDRLDRLFPQLADTRKLAIDKLALSYVKEDDFAERFFLEDLAIGTFRPIFNIDTER